MSDSDLRRPVLLIAVIAAFMAPFMGSAINLALPAIGDEFSANAINLTWVVNSYMLSSAIFLLPSGKVADIAGRKRVFRMGLILFTLSTLMIVFVKSFLLLILLRVAQGISSALIFSTSLAIIASVFPPGERGRAMGINVTAVYVGLSAGPFLGGLLTRLFGWRSIFLFLVPLGLLSLFIIYRYIREEWAESKNEKFDWRGSLLYGISMFLMMYGFSQLPGIGGFTIVGAGLVLFLIFILFERRVEHPVLNLSLITGNRIFAFSSVAAFIHYAATSAIGFFLSLYLQYIKGMNPAEAGIVLISMPVSMALLSPLAGRLSDRFNAGVIASWGMALTAAGIIVLVFISPETPVPSIIAVLIVMGTGFAFFSSPNTNAIMSSVERRHLGLASGMVGTMRMTGQTVSMGISMMLFALFIGREMIVPSNYDAFMSSMKTALLIFSLLCIVGIFASLARNRRVEKL
jgi:EmrB/QacA subfamily drug resistance transporter